MRRLLPKLWAFWKRDWQLALTYRYTFLIEIARICALFLSFFFIGRLFTEGAPHPALEAYGGDYFRFVFVAVAFGGFMSAALGGVTNTIAFERSNGTLEAILLTPTSFTTIAIGGTLANVLLLTGKVLLYLLIGILVFRADLSQANWLSTIPVLALTVSTFLGLGLVSGGFFLMAREVSPLEAILGWASRFLAGVYFPVSVLPDWLEQVARWLPLTHTLEALRKALIHGASLQEIGPELTGLLAFSIVLLPVGVVVFRWALRETERLGRLGFEG